MKYCPECAGEVTHTIPEGDNRLRYVCNSCDTIHYHNPKNVVGCLLEWEGKVLLCKRSIEPRYGYWTLPAGFMENGESLQDGAAREAREEAMATAEDLSLFAVYNLPRISQIYIMFHGTLKDGFADVGEESLDVGLFEKAQIPWDELAFPAVTECLQRYYDHHPRSTGWEGRVHTADIHSRPGQPVDIVRHTAT